MRNNENKMRIEEAALKLFYENGYTNTTIEDIANKAGVYKTSIQYYYKSKAVLAYKIYTDKTKERADKVAAKIQSVLGKYDMEQDYGVNMYISALLLEKDELARRFYYELCSESLSSFETLPAYVAPIAFSRRYQLDIDYSIDEPSLIGYAFKGASVMLFISFYDGLLKCTWEDYIDYQIRTGYTLLHYDPKHIEGFLKSYKKTLSKIDYKILPYFTIE